MSIVIELERQYFEIEMNTLLKNFRQGLEVI
jgi:hypothetical protein